LAPAKISEEASCSIIHLQGQSFLHHNRMLVVIPACVCARVYIYTHTPPVLCTLYTHRDTACTQGCTPRWPRTVCVGALQSAPTALQLAAWAPGPWHSSPVCVRLRWCCPCQPRLLPPCPAARWVAWGQDVPWCTACPKHCAGC